MRMLGDVGQIEVVQANVRNPASVARALDGAEACVNLVGVLWESGRQKFQSLHVMAAQNVAEAAAKRRRQASGPCQRPGRQRRLESKYFRTKAEGEAAVRAAFPGATIVRPSLVFGVDDKFFNKFAQIAALSPIMPLVGGDTRVQPVFVADVAAVIAKAAASPAAVGVTYELGGPTVYTMREIMQLILTETGRNRPLAPLPWPIASLIGSLGDIQAGIIPLAPPLTSDQVEMLKTDNVAEHGLPGLAEAGVVGTAVEAVVPTYLYRYRKGGQYAETPAGAF
jgi:uncharacterized protein YbjT (DUF2867 family)